MVKARLITVLLSQILNNASTAHHYITWHIITSLVTCGQLWVCDKHFLARLFDVQWDIFNNRLSWLKSVDQLGIVLDTELSDDKDIQRQLLYQYCAANKLRVSVSQCSNAVRHVLFRSFCSPMYASQLWCNFRKACMQRLRVA